MKALSLTQPWAWIILHLGKRIENRSRNIGNYRGPLLLHAAKGMSERDWWSAYDFVQQRFGHIGFADQIPKPRALVRGAIVGRCDVVNQCAPGLVWLAEPGTRTLRHATEDLDERWYMGAFGYVLSDVRPTPHVECNGALGFWRPPEDVARRALEVAI